MQKLNLLQSLCKANNVQGGTIHQFADILAPNFDRFNTYFKEMCIDMNFECVTKNGFKKMAARCNYSGLRF